MLIFLASLLATLPSILLSRAALELENLALRHQIGVLQRSARKRPKLILVDRLLWVWLSRVWSDWRSALDIVQPDTVIAWHRKGFRLFWTWKVRRGHPGRPTLPREARDQSPEMGRVVALPQLGGLHHRYAMTYSPTGKLRLPGPRSSLRARPT